MAPLGGPGTVLGEEVLTLEEEVLVLEEVLALEEG